ncbi:ATP-binding protein [Streptomyces violascens]|nr:ATP-binding protein [Streptomyces violascens]
MAETRARTTGHPGYSETHPCAPGTAEIARRLARTACATWGVEEAAEPAALILSELVTNAVRHTRSRLIRVIVERPADGWLYLAVVDQAPLLVPVRRIPKPGALGGRGLVLVEAFAERWGYDRMGSGLRPWGKRVWARIDTTRETTP